MLAALNEPSQPKDITTQESQAEPRQLDKGEPCIRERRTGEVVCGNKELVPR
jgi:hypothetical protein